MSKTETKTETKRIDLSKPRYDQSNYWGRARHYFEITDPRTVLASDQELDAAKNLVLAYKAGKEPAGTTEDQVWAAKKLYDSAFHPETGEKMFFAGRMSCQVPGNMTITGFMMTFYKSTPQQIFWQWANQTFNATVNYTNRNASSKITNEMLATSYVAATAASVTVAVGMNKIIAASPRLSAGMIGRFIPLISVAGANLVNIPLMRQVELKEGITVSTADGVEVGKSKAAASSALMQVIPSRVLMAVPSMGLTPVVMNFLEKGGALTRYPFMTLPTTILVTGFALVFSTPMCCALFPQQAAIKVSNLEPELQEKVRKLMPHVEELYFNKGL